MVFKCTLYLYLCMLNSIATKTTAMALNDTKHDSFQQITEPAIDWSKCLICQQVTKEHLQCPANSKRKDCGAGYKTFEEDLQNYASIPEFPSLLNLVGLTKDGNIAQTLLINRAQWHKSCRDGCNKTKAIRALKRKILHDDLEENVSILSKNTRSVHSISSEDPKTQCFFCDQVSSLNELTPARTLGLDSRVRSAALQLEDTKLLAKLSAGDMIAIDAVYHKKCLASLYNRVRSRERKEVPQKDNEAMLRSVAFAELVSFIEDSQSGDPSRRTFFTLSELTSTYSTRLEQMTNGERIKVHASRLKEKLLAHIPNLRAHSAGRDVMLGFHDDIGWLMSNDCQVDRDVDAICISRAASVIRRELFSECEDVPTSLSTDSQEESVPCLLLALVKMILEGPNIKHQSAKATSQAALSIAQLLKFNSIKHKRSGVSSLMKHNRCKETPLPLYIGAMIHAKTRKRDLVDRMFDLGLSVSYDRVLRLSAGMANAVCERYRETEVVCPPQLRGDVFTTAAVDNIDHNTSSTTAMGSFHGTGISLIQHPNVTGEGTDMGKLLIADGTTTKCITPLPEFYTCVPPVSMNTSQAVVPPTVTNMQCDGQMIKIASENEDQWLQTVSSIVTQKQLGDSDDQEEITTSSNQEASTRTSNIIN